MAVSYASPSGTPNTSPGQGPLLDPALPLVVGQELVASFLIPQQALGSIAGHQLFMDFDPADVSIQQLQAGTLPGFSIDHFNTGAISSGSIKTLWYDATGQGVTASGSAYVLFNVEMRALKAGVLPKDIFQFDTEKSMIFDLQQQIANTPLEVEFRELAPTNKITAIYPNPFSDQVTFEFDLVDIVTINLSLRDALGNQIIQQLNYGPGVHQYTIPSTSSLTIGQLTYEVEIGGYVSAGILFKF